MTTDRTTDGPHAAVTEIDLLGYVDGLLDGDPARRRAVEAFLADHPSEAERVDAYIAQNREIRRLYGPVFNEPLPERLIATLHHESGGVRWLRTAAAVAALLATAAGGWLIGLEQADKASPAASLLSQAPTVHSLTRALPGPVAQLSPASATVLDTRQSDIGPGVDPPDLSALGYTLAGTRSMGGAQFGMAELRYVRVDGHRLSLFIRRRTPADEHGIIQSRSGAGATAHWHNGPLVYGVVGDLDEAELSAVTATIQAAADQPRPDDARLADSDRTRGVPLDGGLAGEPVRSRLVAPEPAVAMPEDALGAARPVR